MCGYAKSPPQPEDRDVSDGKQQCGNSLRKASRGAGWGSAVGLDSPSSIPKPGQKPGWGEPLRGVTG